MLTGNSVPFEEREELIFQMIKQLEGSALHLGTYEDVLGIPTIGYGFAFITAVTVQNVAVYSARDLSYINRHFSGIHQFTATDANALADIAAALNSTHGANASATTLFNNWATGQSLRH